MSIHEQALVFACAGARLIGITTHPKQPTETGVVIIVGGPQYRAGSHRQFTLLARHLAEQGIASIRFDYRGMGDSEGDMRNFEAIDADIKAAIDSFTTQTPSIKQIVLWGLCDAASAALYYGHTDSRVKGMILLNPWVHTEAGAARARLTHYYLNRLLCKTFWAKLFSGKVKIGSSINDLATSAKSINPASTNVAPAHTDPRHGSSGYIDRMLLGIEKFKGALLFILSGQDMTAQEFVSLIEIDKNWQKAVLGSNATIQKLREANHTFSTTLWRNKVAAWTTSFVAAEASLNRMRGDN